MKKKKTRQKVKGKSKTLPLSIPKIDRLTCEEGIFCASTQANHFVNFAHTNVVPLAYSEDVYDSHRVVSPNSEVVGTLCQNCQSGTINKHMNFCSVCGKKVRHESQVGKSFEYKEEEETKNSPSSSTESSSPIIHVVYIK